MSVLNERYNGELWADKARGQHIWLNGQKLVDFCMGSGTHLFGHAPEFLWSVVSDQFGRGTLYSVPNRLAEEYAAEFARHAPFDKLVFCNTGSEAVMRAFRIARACTGRHKIALVHGFHHGSYFDPDVVVIPQDDTFVEVLDEHRVAMVFVEPFQGSNPQLQLRFMRRLAAYCVERGILLGFDEVISGFRCPGAKGYDITPDLATYGKIAGGGFPIGLVAGKAGVMEVVRGGVFMGGTFSANPMSVRAGLEVIRRITPDVTGTLDGKAEDLMSRVNARCSSLSLMGVGSMLRLMFMPRCPRNCQDRDDNERGGKRAVYSGLLDGGVHVGPNGLIFLSTKHTDADIALLADRIVEQDACLG